MFLIKVGVWGMAGAVSARIGGKIYTDYLSKYVIGDETDVKGTRHIASEVARLIAMAALPYAVERAMLKRAIRPIYSAAYLVGGMGETLRQGVGVLLLATGNTTANTVRSYGFDGPGEIVQHYTGADGYIYGQDKSGTWWRLGQSNGMGELVPEGEFGDLVPESEFAGNEYDDAVA